ncbi:MAG: AAA family ATPase [Spirochaetales bacterium]|nr:AAA family ATPase [Spirochaetales bacterium]
MNSKTMTLFKKKAIAVASGKGGVGKTTTAVNLAIYFARNNLRVGLFDLDPLSDVAILLGLSENIDVLKRSVYERQKKSLKDYVIKVFDHLDLLFPFPKLKKDDSADLLAKIIQSFLKPIVDHYDVVILDLPAGIREEDNLNYLHYVGQLVMVTNSEPTSHVSAGGYIKAVFERIPGLPVLFWHNKYETDPGSEFNSQDVIGNYNKNVTAEERIPLHYRKQVQTIAHIPKDPALDLLQSNPSISLNIQRNMINLLDFMVQERFRDFSEQAKIPPRTFELIKYFLLKDHNYKDKKDFLVQLGNYIGNIIRYFPEIRKKHLEIRANIPKGISIFTDEQVRSLTFFYGRMKNDGVKNALRRIVPILEYQIATEENKKRLFFVGNAAAESPVIDREISSLLISLEKLALDHRPALKNAVGLLTFYYALFKVFQSTSVVNLVNSFVPVSKSKQGKSYRDKYLQIKNLIGKNNIYRKRYFQLIKTLFPVVFKTLQDLAQALGISRLLYKTRNGEINREAYVKLFSHFIHEVIHSGLGVIIGFPFRPASKAFEQSASRLQKLMISLPLKAVKAV